MLTDFLNKRRKRKLLGGVRGWVSSSGNVLKFYSSSPLPSVFESFRQNVGQISTPKVFLYIYKYINYEKMWPISVKRWEPVSGSAPEGSSYRESIAHKTVPPGLEDHAAENLDDAFMIQAGKWRVNLLIRNCAIITWRVGGNSWNMPQNIPPPPSH